MVDKTASMDWELGIPNKSDLTIQILGILLTKLILVFSLRTHICIVLSFL